MAKSNNKAIELHDKMTCKLAQARAICSVVSVTEDSDQIPANSIQDSLWAARELMNEAEGMADQLLAIAQEVKHG